MRRLKMNQTYTLTLFILGLMFNLTACHHFKKTAVQKHPLENNYTYKKISAKSYKKQGLIPLEDFFRNPVIIQVKISPNGKYLAYLKPYKKRLNIYVKKIGSKKPEKRLTSQTDRGISYFLWKEDETLVFARDFGGDENTHFFRVSAQGKGEKNLTPFKGVKHYLVDDLDQISEESLLISSNKRDPKVFDVYRLNVKTGAIDLVEQNPGHFTGWMTDHKGQLRIAFSTDGLNDAVYYRDTEKEPFKQIIKTNFKDKFHPLLFDFDNKNIYVRSNIKKDKAKIQLFNPKTGRILKTLFSHPEVDAGGLVYSKKNKKLLYTTYTTWKRQHKFFDANRERIYKKIQSQFPKKYIIFVSRNREEDRYAVYIGSDRDPGAYYLYDLKSKKLTEIAKIKPWLKETELAEMKAISYKSRDGLTIPAYLTLPKNSKGKNLPLIVNPHGGPSARDTWGYDSTAQFLANRGYAVLQMNFRGSTGYGKKFWKAGFKQWGRKMQDDVTDGVKYLINQGIADKDKVCIYGGSYGGYAALAGVAFTPDLYACGISYVGVSNLFTLLESIPPYWEPFREQAYEMEGHPVKDKNLLKAVSPVFHADKIKTPLFVAHGANDVRVKKAESDQIVSSLSKRGIEPLYMVKYDEGHGFANEENKIEFYTLMEEFLKKHLQ